MAIALCVTASAGIVCASSVNFWMLIIFRVIAGVGIGGSYVAPFVLGKNWVCKNSPNLIG